MTLHQHINVPTEFKASGEAGSFEGYAAIFGNVDLGGDVIEPGAFKEIVRGRAGLVKVLNQHRIDDPIGVAQVTQDQKGLRFQGRLILDVPTARASYALMKSGALDGMSIGFHILPGGAEVDREGVRVLRALRLYEISPVTFGMNPLAGIDSVKHLSERPETLRQFEDALKSMGFSRREAARIATKGWSSEDSQSFCPDPSDLQTLQQALVACANSLKGQR